MEAGFLLSLKAVPVMERGEIAGTRGVIRNITDREQAEAELIHYREHLEELVSAHTAEL